SPRSIAEFLSPPHAIDIGFLFGAVAYTLLALSSDAEREIPWPPTPHRLCCPRKRTRCRPPGSMRQESSRNGLHQGSRTSLDERSRDRRWTVPRSLTNNRSLRVSVGCGGHCSRCCR